MIRLTDPIDGMVYIIRPDEIAAFFRKPSMHYTDLYLTGNGKIFHVKETPDEILNLMQPKKPMQI